MSVASEPDTGSPADPAPPTERSRSALVRYGLTPWDGAALISVLLLLTAFLPELTFPNWTPQFAAMAALAPVGFAALVLRCRARIPAALALASVLVWATLSSVLSESLRSSFFGFAGRDMSTLSLIACASLWALGTQTSARGRDVAGRVLIWTMVVMSLIGIVQVIANIQGGSLALQFDRATALYSNPVYFGALCGAAAAAVPGSTGLLGRTYLIAGPCLGAGVAVSGSRVAAGALVLLLVLQAVVHRNRRSWLGGGAVIAGFVAGVAIDRAFGHGTNAASRLSYQGSDGRSSVWDIALDTWLERPVIGHGPGMFRPSVQGRFDLEFTRDYANEELIQAWFDPHNALVHVLVIGGVVLAALLLAWVGLWARHARGPLVWSAAAIALTWSLQPLSMSTVPLACLLFGIAGATAYPSSPVPRRRVLVPLVAIGAFASVWLVVADVALTRAVVIRDADLAATVAPMYFGDPVASDVVAQLYALEGDVADEIRWRERSVEIEPNRPYWWSELAHAQLVSGDVEGAERSVAAARALQPYNARAIRADSSIAIRTGDVERLGRNLDLLCRLELAECGLEPSDVMDVLAGLDAAD